MMKANWEKFGVDTQELVVTSLIEANLFGPSAYMYGENPSYWSWNVTVGDQVFSEGQAKTESLVKRIVERELIKLFRELGKALDYDVE